MKKVLQSILIAILVGVIGLTAVSCSFFNKDNNDGKVDETVTVDKAALNAELALEITEQGDYTADSYNAYAAKLAEAKTVAADEAATQEAIDAAAIALTEARLALAIRPVLEVEGGNKSFRLISGDEKEITLTDYVDENGLEKITYEVKTSNAVVELSSIVDGKFTITAGAVRKETDVKVSIIVSYDNVEKLEVELSVTITNDVAPIVKNESVVKEYDLFDLDNKESLVLDFAENVDNAGNLALTYSVKCGEDELALDGTRYTLTLGSYADEAVYQTFTVTVSYTANGVAGTITYTYKLGLKDTGAYRVAGGDFENGVADGWTASDESFGAIDDKSTFWDQQFPMFNVGRYFSSAGSEGSLASPYFKVHSKYATYMLGAAGKENVYITIEDTDGNVLALYRNTKFADLPSDVTDWEAQRQLIGVSVFVCNLVTYKVDISAFEGQSIRFVIHDHEEGDGGFGFVYFDELITYYASEDEVPENATLAENLLADKVALNAELALEVTAQGDYTEDSFNAYLAKLADAKALAGDVAATQAKVDAATAALTEAREALAVRPVLEVEGANKSFRLFSGNTQDIEIAAYINENGLSNITYALEANNAVAALSAITDGKFTITAGEVSETTVVAVSIIVSYNGVEKLTVELSVEITNDLAPTVKNAEVSKSYDIYLLDNKESILVDFSENIDNPGNLVLTYSINSGYITTPTYTYNFTYDYTDKEIGECFYVTVSYVANGVEGSIYYEYVLNVKDTTEYRLENGGFENGIDGWTVVGNIGAVSSDKNYWVEEWENNGNGYEFGMDGENMFSAYATNDEAATGTLTSSSFKVGGSGYVTFKLGAGRNGSCVYIDVVDANTGKILERYYNGLWAEYTNDLKSGCSLIAYRADLSAFKGQEVYFRISDIAYSDYGLFFADSFITYYEIAPQGFADAVKGNKYEIANGSFETGNLNGWTMDITEAGGQNTLGWVQNEEINVGWYTKNDGRKDGRYLFTFAKVDDTNCEKTKGTLNSSVFTLKQNSYVSFRFGGAGNPDLVYIQLCKANGEVIATFYNNAPYKVNTEMHAYYYQYTGEEADCFFRVVDNAHENYGCFVVDDFRVNLENKPNGFLDATKGATVDKYELVNGSFENGLDGWTMDITEAGGQNTLGWVQNEEINADWYTQNYDRKDGSNLFTFAKPDGTNCENTKGTLNSATFTLKQNSYVSFKFGGAGTREVWIELVKANGEVITRFYNEAPGKANTEMYAYYYQYTGEETDCFFRVVDNSTGNYGCFVVDDFRVNLDSAPEGFIAAIQ